MSQTIHIRNSRVVSVTDTRELGIDAEKWAAEFRKTAIKLGYSDMDEGWLIAWFANAIIAGRDAEARSLIQSKLTDEAEP